MDFNQKVYDVVRTIPHGHVATYGQIAAMISSPRAARMVGTALRSMPDGTDIPWHRVISSKGYISIQNMEHPADEQANLLMAEGVSVKQQNNHYSVDLSLYLWNSPHGNVV